MMKETPGLLFVLASSCLLAETDLKLPNPGFEQQARHWKSANAMAKVTQDAARSGALGLRVTDSDPQNGSSLTSAAVPVEPGSHIALKFWARNGQQNSPVGVYVQFLDRANRLLNSYTRRNELIFSVPPTKGWQQFTFVNQAPKDAAKIRLWIHSYQAARGTVDFDDFRVSQLNQDELKTVKTTQPVGKRRQNVTFPVPSKQRIQELAKLLPEKPATGFPHASQRNQWSPFAKTIQGKAIIDQAEQLIGTPRVFMDPEVYLQYSRTGNRKNYERLVGLRNNRIRLFTMAEAFEYKGRFIKPLEDELRALMTERSWTLPAHDASLTNFNQTQYSADLVATHLAKRLAFILYLLEDKLDAKLRQDLKAEIMKRVFTPYREIIRTGIISPGHWWVVGTSNWNAVCTDGVIRAALAFFEDRMERAEFVAAMEQSNPFFISGFTEDGYCTEGMSYWSYGYGHFLQLGEAILKQTGGAVNIFSDPKIERISAYPKNLQIDEGVCPAFADCGISARPDRDSLLLIQRRFPQALLKRIEPLRTCPASLDEADTKTFFDDAPYARNAPENATFPRRSLFENAGIYIGRDFTEDGIRFGSAIKAGHNNEHHNHNDVGSFTVTLNQHQYFLDPGGEIYTRRTFSKDRYVSQMLNSYGHMVPVVAGQLQPVGAEARGTIVKTDFTDQQDTVVLDLKQAYHNVPQLKSLVRTLVLNRRNHSLSVTDEVEYTSPQTFETPLVTFDQLTALTDSSVIACDGAGAVKATFTARGAAILPTLGEIQNDNATNPTRLALALDKPVTQAAITVVFTPEEVTNLPGFYRAPDEASFNPQLQNAVTIQAEDIQSQQNGRVIVTSKVGDSGKSFKMWDDRGHQITWNANVPQDGTYAILLRLCTSFNSVLRSVAVDGKTIHPDNQPLILKGTKGWSSGEDNWENLWLATPTPEAKAIILKLTRGKHTITMTNADGRGLNLDWIKLVPATKHD